MSFETLKDKVGLLIEKAQSGGGGTGEVGKPYIDTSKMTSFKYFCEEANNLDAINGLDTSNGTDFSYMFSKCGEKLATYNIFDTLDTSNGTNFNSMFSNCSYGLSEVTADMLNTSNGTSFNSMFQNCNYGLKKVSLDTSNGTNFGYMFQNCVSLQEVNIDTSNGTNFNGMFRDSRIPEVSLDTSNGTNFSYMFFCDYSLTKLSITTTKGDLVANAFQNCTKLTDLTIGDGFAYNIIISHSDQLTQESLHGMIENLADLTDLTAKTFKVGSTNLAKIDEEHITMLENKNWNYS